MTHFAPDQLFENAFHNAAVGMALVGPDGRFLRVNRSLCDLVGYPEDMLLRRTFQDITHPDDVDADLSLLQQLIRGEVETYRMEKRYFHRDGRVIWVLLSVSSVRNAGGELEFVISQMKDITERKLVEDALRSTTARLTAVVMNLQAGVLVQDENSHVVLANQTFCEMFGLELLPAQLVGAGCVDVLEEASRRLPDPEQFMQRIHELLTERGTANGEELRLRDGRILERDCVPIFANGVYFGQLWSHRDVTRSHLTRVRLEQQAGQLQQANANLKRQATTDDLTGLANRRALHKRLFLEWKRAARSGGCLCLVMMDLDFFKAFNDTFGHQAGDTVLRRTAALLQLQTRAGDLAARYGGEEFAIVLSAASLDEARVFTERFRHAIESADWPLRSITASFGVACTEPSKTQSAETGTTSLIAQADAALYEAKLTGRNRVCTAA